MFKPGDSVKRVSGIDNSYNGVLKGKIYIVLGSSDSGEHIKLVGIKSDWKSEYFELVRKQKLPTTALEEIEWLGNRE